MGWYSLYSRQFFTNFQIWANHVNISKYKMLCIIHNIYKWIFHYFVFSLIQPWIEEPKENTPATHEGNCVCEKTKHPKVAMIATCWTCKRVLNPANTQKYIHASVNLNIFETIPQIFIGNVLCAWFDNCQWRLKGKHAW